MILPVRELLTSQFDGGLWHARYPTATRTICGLVAHPQLGRKWAPSCPACIEAAKAWHAIDNSAPSHWRYRRVFKRAA